MRDQPFYWQRLFPPLIPAQAGIQSLACGPGSPLARGRAGDNRHNATAACYRARRAKNPEEASLATMVRSGGGVHPVRIGRLVERLGAGGFPVADRQHPLPVLCRGRRRDHPLRPAAGLEPLVPAAAQLRPRIRAGVRNFGPRRARHAALLWRHGAGRSAAGAALRQSWQRAGLTCISEQSGVSCRNARGHGFTLSRAAQSVF